MSMTESMAERQATAIGPAERPQGALGSARAEAHARQRGRASLFVRLGAEVRFAPIERKFLYVLLLLFFAKGIIYTLVFPAFSGHDEVAHYTYIRFVAEEGRVPIMPELETWQARTASDQPTGEDRLPDELYKYCQYFTQDWWRGCSETRWLRDPPRMVSLGTDLYPSGWVYTANHPPFYYLLMTPLYWLSAGQTPEVQLYLFRLVAIPFGLLTVVLAYLTTRTLFPGDQFLATTVPAFVAFQPQIAYEAAMLNNDILAIAFTSWALYLVVSGLRDRFPLRTCVLLGFVLGLAVLTKGTSVTAAPIIAFALFFGLGWRNVRQWLPRGALITAITLVMIWPWYLFLYAEYGDLSGLTRVKELQWWNYTFTEPPTVLGQLFDGGFAWMRWRETWGEFGWRLIPLTPGLLRLLLGLCIFALVGLGIYVVRVYRARRAIAAAANDPDASGLPPAADDPVLTPNSWQRLGISTMLVTCVIAYFAILQFGTEFSLTQARYYFPAINALALLLMLGLRSWFPRAWHPYVQTAVFVGLVALNVSIFSQFVIPYWNEGL